MWPQLNNRLLNYAIPLLLYCIMLQYEGMYEYNKMCGIRSEQSRNRRKKVRVRWDDISQRMGDYQFRRMFRMTRECFSSLCHSIIGAIGESKFKSQHYIDAFLSSTNIYNAHVLTTGGYISGEVKLAITIRLLAGGDALDLAIIFDIYPSYLQIIMKDVLANWIIQPNIGKIDMLKYLNNFEDMSKVSKGFAVRSNGVLKGCIGAIDGWLVKIVRPCSWWDGLINPVPFYSRKGYYALNVQCIVDDRKKVLWAMYNNKGASHDSTCFKKSHLYTILKGMSDYLYERGLFILGDSAYAIESFLLPPYDSPLSQSPEDNYNFFHSSQRITVECAFGEIDLRWGIFWKRLWNSVDTSIMICEGAMHLHNFLVEYRDAHDIDYNFERNVFENDCSDNGFTSEVVGNDGIRPRMGRRSSTDEVSRQKGLQLRDKLRQAIYEHDMVRPRKT